LTAQLIQRLAAVFGDDIQVYHSKLNHHQRVEIWNAVMAGQKIILGARSSLFLPFQDLGLVIIDEEHDPSYKQSEPAPRYQGRDTAIYLAHMHKAEVILGSATPSLSSYYNASLGKFGLVSLMQRHGSAPLPTIEIIDLREKYKKGLMQSIFSNTLKDAIDNALAREEQVLIFQNRRGYSPTLQCTFCDFKAECPNCDVGLTVHKYFDQLRCHYCGYQVKLPKLCPSCGQETLKRIGYGTEKIEDEIAKVFPKARIQRMDYDTANTKTKYESILWDFKNGEIDILIGTQMITKGLDFANLSVVAVPDGDRILNFPDYQANERAFQLFTQVAGRAGRRDVQGKVFIQTFNPNHPVIQETQTVKGTPTVSVPTILSPHQYYIET
ncbi:unnamed protein product, partial [Cyprideis torosa]